MLRDLGIGWVHVDLHLAEQAEVSGVALVLKRGRPCGMVGR
jgi:hypothetical protein